VVEFYRNTGKLACVHGVGSMDEVFTRIVEAINPTSDVG
jgi:adenylate kinase